MADATKLVVDSSVAVKWFLAEGEAGVEEALDLLRAHVRGETLLAAPEHLRLEALNALLHRGVTAGDLKRAAAALDGLHLEWRRVDGPLVAAAVDIARARALTLYDAAFAALACELDGELVTADRRLIESGACRVRALAR